MKKLLLILLSLIPSVAFAGEVTRDGFIYEEKSAPSSPPANRHHTYVDSADQRMKTKDSGGTVNEFIFNGDVATTSEVNTGTDNEKYISPSALNNSDPTLAGATITESITNQVPAEHAILNITGSISPASASTQLVEGIKSLLYTGNTTNTTLPGHGIAIAGTFNHNQTNTYPLGIGVEGLFQNSNTGTVTEGAAALTHWNVAAVGSTTSKYSAFKGLIGDLAGGSTSDAYYFNAESGTPNADFLRVYGFRLGSFNEGTGDVDQIFFSRFEDQVDNEAELYGFYMDNQTGTHSAKYFLFNACPSCISYIGNSLAIPGTSSGFATLQSSSAAGGVQTIPNATGTIILDIDSRYIQHATTTDATDKSGTTTVPLDDTKPQNTEGNEWMTVSITPTNASSILLVETELTLSNTIGALTVTSLYQDSTADALRTCAEFIIASTITTVRCAYEMTAGTTSSTTFKVRSGMTSAGTLYFNSYAGTGYFGDATISWIRVTELQP